MSTDPFRDAFDVRRTAVTTAIDTDAGLVELRRRRAAAERRRNFSAAAVVLLVVGVFGFGLANDVRGRSDPTDLATAARPGGTAGSGQSTSSAGLPVTSASPSSVAPPTTARLFATSTTESSPTSEQPVTTTATTVVEDPGPPSVPVPILATGSSLSEFPCVLDNETLTERSNLATNGPYAAPLGLPPATGIIDVTHEVDDRCERIVITLDGPGFADGTTAGGTPNGARVELPGVELTPRANLPDGVSVVRQDGVTGASIVQIAMEEGATIVSYGDNPARILVDHRANPD